MLGVTITLSGPAPTATDHRHRASPIPTPGASFFFLAPRGRRWFVDAGDGN